MTFGADFIERREAIKIGEYNIKYNLSDMVGSVFGESKCCICEGMFSVMITKPRGDDKDFYLKLLCMKCSEKNGIEDDDLEEVKKGFILLKMKGIL